jgi:hypothetical protein
MSRNKNLNKAKKAKDDEYYTQLNDIENELKHYKGYFKGKVVYLNCDDPTWSSFWKYFSKNFEHLKLKKLVSTHYHKTEPTYKLELCKYGNEPIKTPLRGNGDFRNQECIDILKEADIVVTNPPFSLFREYIAQLIKYDKKFLIIGNGNAISYHQVFSLLKDNKIWLGYTKPKAFDTPTGETKKVYCYWYTNLDVSKRHESIVRGFLVEKFDEKKYPIYDNYDAIEVGRVANIPIDYYGEMGVPISFLEKYNPEEFEITGLMATTKINTYNFGYPYIIGKKKYARLIIKRK